MKFYGQEWLTIEKFKDKLIKLHKSDKHQYDSLLTKYNKVSRIIKDVFQYKYKKKPPVGPIAGEIIVD